MGYGGNNVNVEIEFSRTTEQSRGDIELALYNIVTNLLNKLFPCGYYEEEDNRHESLAGNEYIIWSIYKVDEDNVVAYDIEEAVYWDWTAKIRITGPREDISEEELLEVLSIAEHAGNDEDVALLRKLLES